MQVLPLDVMSLELVQVEDRSSYELQSLKLIEGVGQGSGKFEVIGKGGFGSIYKGIVLRHREHRDMSAKANEFQGVKKLEISQGNISARTSEFKGVKRLGRSHGVLLEKSMSGSDIITEPADDGEEFVVAVKRIALSDEVTREDLDREARTLRVFWGCRNFAAVYGLTYCKQLESVCIVMEVISPGRNLNQFLRSRDTDDGTRCDVLWWIQKLSVFREIVLALMLCHEKGVYHGDLKGENILLNERLIPKLIDFGLSFQMRDVKYLRRGVGGSLFWVAPEVRDAEQIPRVKEDPFPSDVYSLGMLLFEVLLDGEVPDSFTDEDNVMLDKFDGAYPVKFDAVAPSSDSFVSERVIKRLKELVDDCCAVVRESRLSLQECLHKVEDVHSDLLQYAGHREDLLTESGETYKEMRTFRKRFPEVRDYLVSSPSLNMVVSEDGTLLVHLFCRLDFVAGVQYIVERSASWGFQAERDIPYMSLLCVDSESLSTLRYIASSWRDLLRRQHLLIHRACSSSNLDMFQLLLNIGIDVDTWVAEEPFMKPIHQLAAKGKTEFLRCLLDQVDDASYINTATPRYGRCYDGDNGEKIRSWLRHMDDPKLLNLQWSLEDVPRYVPLYYAVVEDRVETVKFILQRGGVYFEKSLLEVTRVSDERGYWFSSLMHLAWKNFAIGVALELLHASYSHPSLDILRQHVEEVALSYPNRKPMHVACQKGRERAFEAAFNLVDYNESFCVIRALMFYIARGGSKEMIDIIVAKTFVDQYFVSETYSIQDVAILLLAEGTSTNLLDSPHSVGRISVLDVAAVSHNTEVVQHILKLQPEDSASEGTITDDESIEAAIPEFRNNQFDLALACCRTGNVEVLKSYERSGHVDLDAVRDDETRDSILHSAVDEAHINMVEYLLQRGFPVDSTNWTLGETPLQHACSRRPDATSGERERKLEIASLLLEKGADPNFVNHGGYTAMDQALDFHDKQVVRFLIDQKFDLGRKDRYGEDYMTRVSNI